MPKPDNQWQELAREAAESVDRQREMGQQLGLFREAAVPAEADEASRAPGRPKGAKNKGTSQLRDWLAARGWSMPEDRLAELAALTTDLDVWSFAIARAEQLLAWMAQGSKKYLFKAGVGHIAVEWEPSPEDKREAFKLIYASILEANKAMMPFVAPKVTPDLNVSQQTTFIMPVQPAAQGDAVAAARDVTPGRGVRMVPADVREEIVQKQGLGDQENPGSDAEIRTEGASD